MAFEIFDDKAVLAKETLRAAGVTSIVEFARVDARADPAKYGEIALYFLDAEKGSTHNATKQSFQTVMTMPAIFFTRVFLFQALFSALAASSLDARRIRILPATYNYPYNLQDRVPQDRRAIALNNLVCFTFEGRAMHPKAVADIEIREPLRSWLEARVAAGPTSRHGLTGYERC